MVSGDHSAGDSVIHIINGLLLVDKRPFYDLVKAIPQLQTFDKYLCRSCMSSYLEGGQQVTIFAPSNAAFDALPTEMKNSLLLNPNKLKRFILQHTYKGLLLTTNLQPGVEYGLRPMDGKLLRILKSASGKVTINSDSKILIGDIMANNGVLHVIDKVILP